MESNHTMSAVTATPADPTQRHDDTTHERMEIATGIPPNGMQDMEIVEALRIVRPSATLFI